MEVNGLPLPQDLLNLIAEERWKTLTDRSNLNRIIPENDCLYLYPVELMESETQGCFRPDMQGPMWNGVPDTVNPPGDIDPALTVFVADIGLGYDQPIALDYRVSREQPRVLTLRWSKGGEINRWIVIAPDILAFAELVGL